MNAIKRLIFILVVVLLPACSPVKMPPISNYTIVSLHHAHIPNYSKTQRILLLSMPDPAPGYASTQMLYVMIPYRLKAFAQHAWIAPPAEMLMPLLAQRIRAEGYYKAVLTPPFAGFSDYRLDTQLLILEQDFLQPVSEVHLVMQATLINGRTNQVVASRRFSATVPAPGNDPYSGVLATNQAAAQVSRQIAQFACRER